MSVALLVWLPTGSKRHPGGINVIIEAVLLRPK
jgi:hypothetical protein